jgi:hypothetical protein
MKDAHVNTKARVGNDGAQRLPHERDEAPDAQNTKPRKVMKQAASDIERGLVDTDKGPPMQETYERQREKTPDPDRKFSP